MSLALSFRSETLKIKRTLAVYVCVLASAFGPFMRFVENINIKGRQIKTEPWIQHFMEGRQALNIALLPMYVILVSTLLLQIEYRDKTWKQVLSSPQRMINIFFAKYLTLQLMILLFIVSYNFFLVLAAFGTEMMHPELYSGEMDYYKLLLVNTQTWILILGVSAIQFFLALRFKNFIGPLAIGLAGWFSAPMMIFEFKTDMVQYNPYAFTIFTVTSNNLKSLSTYQWYSVITAVLFLTLSFWELNKRKVRS
jgi:lantibiotic transport system permease protein